MSPKDKSMNSPTAAAEDAKATVAAGTSPSGEKSPEEIRAEIDETREEMGGTVADLAAKSDVKAQTKAKVDDARDQAKAKVDDLREKAKAAAPESPQEGIAQAQALARQNPKPLAIAGAVVGLFLIWRLLKS